MRQSHTEQVYSVTEFHPAQLIPTDPLPKANHLLPHGITITSTSFPTRRWHVQVPAYAEDHLVIPLDQAMDLTCTLERRYHVCAKPGDITIAPHGVPTEWQHYGGLQLVLLFLAPSMLAMTALETFDADPAQANLTERVAVSDPLIYAITQSLGKELRIGDSSSSLYLESLTHTLVVHLLRTYALRPKDTSVPPGRLAIPQLRYIRDYIIHHLDKPLTLAELATLVNLSPYHFARVFKRTMGQTVHQYVLTQRLEAGKQLLEHTTLSIAAIATQVGFSDHSHFYRQFKQVFGVCPSVLKRQRTIIHTASTNMQDNSHTTFYTGNDTS